MFERNLALYRCPVDRDAALALEQSLKIVGGEIIAAVLGCPGCGRRFPVIDGIPHLVRDPLRHIEEEREFVARWSAVLAADVVRYGLLPDAGAIQRTAADDALLDESAHWGRYLEAFEALGDTAILDIDQKGNHPSLYELGVLEPDLRDSHRRWGLWPDHLGNRVFPRFAEGVRGRGLDLGCGGGQFGLEAAHQGIDTIGQDISVGALGVARRYARTRGYPIDFVYADMANLPLAPESFDWLICKDALHHIPGIDAVMDEVCTLLRPGARAVIYDHVADSRIGNWIRRTFYPWFARKIQSRYNLVETPPGLFGRDSANEKAGSPEVLAALDRLFEPEIRYLESRLYHDLEGLMYYAFGRRMAVAHLTRWTFRALDPVFRALWGPEFVLFVGRWRGAKSRREITGLIV